MENENQQLTVVQCFLTAILSTEEMLLAMYRPDRDFLNIIFQSRVIAAAKKVLGFENKTGKPTKFNLPPRMDLLKKLEKLNCLHELAGKIVDTFVFDQGSSVDAIVNTVVTEQEKENLLRQQKLTPAGRFPCRFPGCTSSFKYDGKSRRSHELKHNPPVQVEEPLLKPQSLRKFPKLQILKQALKILKLVMVTLMETQRKQAMTFSITTAHFWLVFCFLISLMLPKKVME